MLRLVQTCPPWPLRGPGHRSPGRTGSQPPRLLSKHCVSLTWQGSLILPVELSFILFCSVQRRVCRCRAIFQSNERHVLEHRCAWHDPHSSDLIHCHRPEGKDWGQAAPRYRCRLRWKVAVGSFRAAGWDHLRLGHPPPFCQQLQTTFPFLGSCRTWVGSWRPLPVALPADRTLRGADCQVSAPPRHRCPRVSPAGSSSVELAPRFRQPAPAGPQWPGTCS